MAKRQDIPVFPQQLCFCVGIIFLSLILCACPFSSVYKLDKDPALPVDESLVGKWSAMIANKKGKPQPVKLTLDKKNDSEYNVQLMGNFYDLRSYRITKNDSIRGSAYLSMVEDRPFLNVDIKGQTYIVAVAYKNDTLSLFPLADGFTAKYIKSNTDLRRALEVHLKTRIFPKYDDQFCLRQMLRIE